MTGRRVLALTRYGDLGASSRLRFYQYAELFSERGIKVVFSPLLDNALLAERYQKGAYSRRKLVSVFARRIAAMRSRRDFDLVWIEKECLPWVPAWLEQSLLSGIPYALDYDDAVFHLYDQHPSLLVKSAFGRRIDCLMRDAALVVGGNEYLAGRASRAGARNVQVVPTVVDLKRYSPISCRPQAMEESALRVVWIGSPSTAQYLQMLIEPLRELSRRVPFKFRVIGATVSIPGVDVELYPWSADSEAQAIGDCDVGVMPLHDSTWERGKCGYKLIQYMACGLPVVASPIGVNVQLVTNGKNGFLADNKSAWLAALESLLSQSDLRATLGAQGRRLVEDKYCLEATGPTLASLISDAASHR